MLSKIPAIWFLETVLLPKDTSDEVSPDTPATFPLGRTGQQTSCFPELSPALVRGYQRLLLVFLLTRQRALSAFSVDAAACAPNRLVGGPQGTATAPLLPTSHSPVAVFILWLQQISRSRDLKICFSSQTSPDPSPLYALSRHPGYLGSTGKPAAHLAPKPDVVSGTSTHLTACSYSVRSQSLVLYSALIPHI